MVTTGTADQSGHDGDERTLLDETVTLRNMAELRSHVLRLAVRAGLAADRAEAFLIAVNEAVANAIEHAGGRGKLALVQDDERRLIAEVRDAGPGVPCSITMTLPPPDAPRGRGMWIAGKLADRVEIRGDHAGTTVRLEMDLHTP